MSFEIVTLNIFWFKKSTFSSV